MFATTECVEKARVNLIFAGLMLVMLLSALDATILATALPTIVNELGGIDDIGWVITAYLLTQTVSAPLYGRLGDLYGRKRILQIAVVTFLAGSALCGIAPSMTELIAFRALQGLGGGGLMVTTQAITGDIVAARERGKYQGFLGGGFGLASIAGPLLGGFFTSNLSWRWIFYINLPFGIAALALISATLVQEVPAHEQRIDYIGSALLAFVLSSVVLLAETEGLQQSFGWWQSAAAAGVILAALAGFVAVERRAEVPVLPLRLFADRTFTVSSIVGFTVGFALFGSVAYMPMFLQVSQGASPTKSGLEMMPMMVGNLGSSIVTGHLITRTGRYKIFPVLGMALVLIALILLSNITPGSTMQSLILTLVLLGIGLGLVMQVLVLGVQNSVPYADLGAATSAATLFRLVGGAVGTALLGVIFARSYDHHIASVSKGEAITGAVHDVFGFAIFVAAAGAVVTWMLPEKPLRETVAATAADTGQEAGEAFALPSAQPSEDMLVRGLALLADHDVHRAYVAGIAQRAGVQLTPVSTWLLIRLGEDPSADVHAVGAHYGVAPHHVDEALVELRARGYFEPEARAVTDSGCEVFNRLSAARRERLAELSAQWPPEQRAEIAAVLQGLARALVPDRSVGP